MKSLNEQFADSLGAPIEVNGRKVRIAYDASIPRAAREMRLHILDHRLKQGQTIIRVQARSHGAKVHLQDGGTATRFVAWDSSRPATVHMPFVGPISHTASIRLWVSWLTSAGSEDAWTNNTGVVIDERSNAVRLGWNVGGLESPTFDDLIMLASFVMPVEGGNDTGTVDVEDGNTSPAGGV